MALATTATVLGLLGLGLLLVSAKSHGRQLRLERERAGYPEASFGRRAKNPAWVEGLWRRDRIQFWALYVVAGGLLAALFVPLPSLPIALVLGLVFLSWSPSLAFLINGFASGWRLARAWRRPSGGAGRPSTARWAPGAVWGSVAWWGLVALLWTATAFAWRALVTP